MRFLDILLGRTKPVESKTEKLFAISTAQVTLTAKLGLKPANKAALCFRPVESSRFDSIDTDIQQLLNISAKETGAVVQKTKDKYGFEWIVLEDPDFEDLVANIHLASQTLQEEGFGEQLLAAVFKFLEDSQPVYWVYNYKRGKFYPFVPQGRDRDNALEVRLQSLMEREMPLESDLEKWYALWGIPL